MKKKRNAHQGKLYLMVSVAWMKQLHKCLNLETIDMMQTHSIRRTMVL